MLTVPEVCRRLSVNKHAVYRLIAAGRLPAARVGGRYLITEEALDLWQHEDADVYGFPPNPPASLPPLLKSEEVARVLRCSTETVRRLAATGALRGSRSPGRVSHWRFALSDVRAYLDAQVPPAA